jgi:uncharacterized protein (TIGR00251 family)
MIHVHVVPNAKIDNVVGKHGGAIKIRLRAPAVEGKANRALINFLAEKLGIAQREISIQAGEKSRNKIVRIEGLDEQTIKDRLLSNL